jgi:hypothetical protein
MDDDNRTCSIFCLIYKVASCSLCLSFTTGYVPVAHVAHCTWSNTNLGNKTSAARFNSGPLLATCS